MTKSNANNENKKTMNKSLHANPTNSKKDPNKSPPTKQNPNVKNSSINPSPKLNKDIQKNQDSNIVKPNKDFHTKKNLSNHENTNLSAERFEEADRDLSQTSQERVKETDFLKEIEKKTQTILKYEQEAQKDKVEPKKRNQLQSSSYDSHLAKWKEKKDELLLCYSRKRKAEEELRKLNQLFDELSAQENALRRELELQSRTGM